METKNSKCLVLNADYTPLTIISWKKALVWSFKHEYDHTVGVEIIDFYKNDYILGTNNKKHPIRKILILRTLIVSGITSILVLIVIAIVALRVIIAIIHGPK